MNREPPSELSKDMLIARLPAQKARHAAALAARDEQIAALLALVAELERRLRRNSHAGLPIAVHLLLQSNQPVWGISKLR